MPLRKSFLSRRISTGSFSFSFSKSLKEFRFSESVHSSNFRDDDRRNDAVESEIPDRESSHGVSWSSMLPELLGEIIRRVEVGEDQWPERRDVAVCGCVCKRWREVTREIIRSPLQSRTITFPTCLKQPGPREVPLQCLIRRNKKNGTFYLSLARTPSSFTDKGKFLLAARRYRNGANTEYIISLDSHDLSQGSKAYVGKLSSDFLGTNFTIYDSNPPHSGAKPSSSRAGRRFASKQISPQVPAGNFEVGQVSYKFNLLKSRGPRRMICSLKCPCSDEIITEKPQDVSATKKPESSLSGQTILRNKAPRWHEHLQCWCLNFHGRVTVASVKNFQLVATLDQSQLGGKGDEETVLLQFGKVGDNTFTMDYRQPLSAFQAFAICLTSFGTKLACE